MVCVAAFIILLVIWLFTPALKLFGAKKQAKAINEMFKKSVYCFTRRATFRACDSNFKDEIKNSILRKLIIRHKKWVKPVSWVIEVVAGLVVLITVWSILTLIKSGLALYVYGTCNIEKPDSCALNSAEACTIDGVNGESDFIRWFTEWGDIFSAIPARMTTWRAEDLVASGSSYYGQFGGMGKNSNSVAVDIFDPGCVTCRRSFTNQKQSGFFEKYQVHLIPYVITGENGDKFKNSRLIASYLEAVRATQPDNSQRISPEWYLVEKIFTGKDSQGLVWQENFNGVSIKAYSTEKVENKIIEWLKEAGYTENQISDISKKAKSEEISKKLARNAEIVEKKIQTKKIPTLIYEGKRHDGIFKSQK